MRSVISSAETSAFSAELKPWVGRRSWQIGQAGRLWEYNLHYFEYLWALEFDSAKAVVQDWIDNHPLERRAVGWEPYPTSLSLDELVCGVLRSPRGADCRGSGVPGRVVAFDLISRPSGSSGMSRPT